MGSWVARWEPPVRLAIPITPGQSVPETDISYPSNRPSIVAPVRLSVENLRVFDQLQAECDDAEIGTKQLCGNGLLFYPVEETLGSKHYETSPNAETKRCCCYPSAPSTLLLLPW